MSRGWQVTGLARAADEEFVRGTGADFTTRAEPGWDAVADAAVLQERCCRSRAWPWSATAGAVAGVIPSADPAPERGVRVVTVSVRPDRTQLADLLARTASGALPARVHAVLPLDRAADAHRAVAKGGARGRYVLQP